MYLYTYCSYVDLCLFFLCVKLLQLPVVPGPGQQLGQQLSFPKVHHWNVGAAFALHGLRDRFLGSWLDQENKSCQNWRIQKSPQNLGGTHKTLAWKRIFLLYDLGIFAFHIAFSTYLGLSKAANVLKVFEDKISLLVCNSLGTIQGEPWCCANSVDWESAALDPQKMQQLGIVLRPAWTARMVISNWVPRLFWGEYLSLLSSERRFPGDTN